MGREYKLTDEERKVVKTCVEALEAHFKPKRNVVYERYVSNMCPQNAEKTVNEFVNRIRKTSIVVMAIRDPYRRTYMRQTRARN